MAAIGQVAGAVTTAAAVGVSLWIALREHREILRLVVGRRLVFAGDGTPGLPVVSFTVTNLGSRPVYISNFGWKVGRFARAPGEAAARFAIQFQDETNLGQNPPFELLPGQYKSMIVRYSRLQIWAGTERDIFREATLPLIGSFFPPVYGSVFTGRGTSKTVRVEAELRKALQSPGTSSTPAEAADQA